MTSTTLSRRLEKLEATARNRGLSALSDAELAAHVRDLWAEAFADGVALDPDLRDCLENTARLYGVERHQHETPGELWARVRPALDAVVQERKAKA